MVKKLSFFVYKIFVFFDNVFHKITKKNILIFFNEFIQNDSYQIINILNRNINFFVPNQLIKLRVDTFFTKEPETLEWIDNFHDNQKIIFWDIGANIGLYSIYAALKNKNIEIISFEPSTSNLRVLSRNISINRLENIIKIIPFPLSNKENQFLIMKEGDFVEGGSLNSFGESFNYKGKRFNSKNNYKIYGTTINYLLKNKLLSIPNYIKIDVDGIEHLILNGGNEFLNDNRIKSISIEINENFAEQYRKVLQYMSDFNFIFKHKKHSSVVSHQFLKIYNYVFERKT